MAASPPAFPPRKRRPSATSFVPSNFSDHKLLQSLLLLSQDISSLKPLSPLLKRNSRSIIRKTKLIAVLFEELLRNPITCFSSSSAVLCFQELYIVLQRVITLIEDCSNGSKMWLLMQNESLSSTFHELTVDLWTLLDIFPVRDMNLNEDVEELVALIKKQCSEPKAFVDPTDNDLRRELLKMFDQIKREIVPDHSKLAEIFDRLNLRDSTSCRDEIESLEDEVQNLTDEKSKSDVIALIGLVRYAKCVLFGESTPRTTSHRCKPAAELTFPPDFLCPISLDLMRDAVVVATGQTYDRASITMWMESGHNTCPKTGQKLAHTHLIPNCALKNLIASWCRQQRLTFETTETNDRKTNGVVKNKTALEATKMTVSFLVNKLTVSQSMETTRRVVHELRALSKSDSDCRACIAEAGALPLLVNLLGSEYPNLQGNAVTMILNLSTLEANKARIMETDGLLNGIIEVLRTGTTWEAKGNAAATIFSLTTVHAYRKKIGRNTRVINGLMDLAKDGTASSKRDALVAILRLAGDRETAGKLVEGGVMDMAGEVMDELPEEAVTILEVVVRRGGLAAIAASYRVIRKLANVLRVGRRRVQESAAATLVYICRKGGSETVAELAAISRIERVIWEVMENGTARGASA
ncbi:hypothetical protein F0562_015146 [Nyssa sinensis]|uniref:RING-type E3 ubiquitin transferase n=1 Tax=Nyssa sinensis TaxID=561372 RepID=A0A5J4ZJJ7_9ASTE|nr:hypothetical protein F0562_015146 [Nyssa sinensis]